MIAFMNAARKKDPFPGFGLRLKAARERSGRKQQELAQTIDVSISTISRAETKDAAMKANHLARLLSEIGASADEVLLGGAPTDPPYDAWREFLAMKEVADIEPWERAALGSMRFPEHNPTAPLYLQLFSVLRLYRTRI